MSSTRPAVYQITDFVRALAKERGLALGNLAVDDSGTQSVASVLEVEAGTAPVRCNFAAKASANPHPQPGVPVRPRFKNLVTEMWYRVAALGREGRLRRFPESAARQFCSRRFRRGIVPLALETKDDYAGRNAGRSPDEADALALCVLAAERTRVPERPSTGIRGWDDVIGQLSSPRSPVGGAYDDNVVDGERFAVYAAQ